MVNKATLLPQVDVVELILTQVIVGLKYLGNFKVLLGAGSLVNRTIKLKLEMALLCIHFASWMLLLLAREVIGLSQLLKSL